MLDFATGGHGYGAHSRTALGQEHQPRPSIVRIRSPFDVPEALHLADDLRHRLFAHMRETCQLADGDAARASEREDVRVGRPDIAEPGVVELRLDRLCPVLMREAEEEPEWAVGRVNVHGLTGACLFGYGQSPVQVTPLHPGRAATPERTERMSTTIDMTIAGQIQNLLDRAEITDLVHRLGVCLDEARFDELRSVIAENAILRSPGGTVQGIDGIVTQAARIHPAQDGIVHTITNVLIDLAGDSASARANLIVSFASPSDTDEPVHPPTVRSIQGQVYHFDFVRTEAGWRFSSLETTPVWRSADLTRVL